MAIFSLHCKIIGKGKQPGGGASLRSVVAAAAYRAGAKLCSLQENLSYDYTKKQGVVYSEVMLPQGADEQLGNRETLWNKVAELELRPDAQYCRELMIALPAELSREECIKLARGYIRKTFVDKGMIADFSLHDPVTKGDQRNPHIHVMLTMRELTPEGKLGNKKRAWNDRSNVPLWREHWAQTCNKWLERGGFTARIDHRSYKAQGVDKVPTVHIGTNAAALERKGIRTAKGDINRSVRAANAAKECGVKDSTILDMVSQQWQQVRELRGKTAAFRPRTKQTAIGSLPQEMRDTGRVGVQRRTYTLRCNVVRSGQTPTPPGGEKYALLGDGNAEKQNSRASPLPQKAAPPSKALQKSAQKLSFLQWLKVRFHSKKREQERGGYSSLYNVKVIASTLNVLSEAGITSYDQIAEKLSGLERRCMEITSRLDCLTEGVALYCQLEETLKQVYQQQPKEPCPNLAEIDKELAQYERLKSAALNCAANRTVGEQYRHKLLFKENYLKLHQRAIEAFEKGAAVLNAAGLDERINPLELVKQTSKLKQQRVQLLEQWNRQVDERRQQETGAAVAKISAQLRAAGFGELPDSAAAVRDARKRLVDEQYNLGHQLRNQQYEHGRWSRIQEQALNILEGKPVKSMRKPDEPKRNERDRQQGVSQKEQTPSHSNSER